MNRDRKLVLGLDIGATSIGWALVGYERGKPSGIERLGVRCFEAGVDGDIETGRDEPKAQKRRAARLQRRQIWRRKRRLVKLARSLQRAGLLPAGSLKTPADRLAFFTELDRATCARFLEEMRLGPGDLPQHTAHVVPYLLRAKALDHRLDPFDVGRALYHLGQRRGFKTNRRSAPRKDEDPGKVKQAISLLQQQIRETGCRTLGEYFTRVDPRQERIRCRWTSREMYEGEFEAIAASQRRFHPSLLSEEVVQRLRRILFYQRPLKSQKGRVGHCELEKNQRRAPVHCPEFQRFRYLQRLNDLEIVSLDDGTIRSLTEEERARLIPLFESQLQVTFPGIAKALGLKRKRVEFNLERGGEKGIPGNVTFARLAKVFDDRWNSLSEADRLRVIEDVNSINKEEVLCRRGLKVWGLTEDQARALSALSLEEGYASYSKKAINRLLPGLREGHRLSEIVAEIYGRATRPPAALLPSLQAAALAVRNPAVNRALSELRKVVNAIVRVHGKPHKIRIELARDLRQSRDERKRRTQTNRENEQVRLKAKENILKELGHANPSGADIERVLLAEECGRICPYTGRSISMEALLGPNSQFDVEHIIPYPRCLDDSFANKTLCYHEENRAVKRNRTPHEAYSGTARWEEILDRVGRFHGRFRDEKLRRFRLADLGELGDFPSRLLNDTRYSSRLAMDYLSLLYGGAVDEGGTRRIQAGKGGATAVLRNGWGLNGILGGGATKNRDDHRHHALDALLTALTDAETLEMISTVSAQSEAAGRLRWWNELPSPWHSFKEDTRSGIDNLIVSHRVSRKVSGPLHEETLYRSAQGTGPAVRKRVDQLSAKEVEKIVDSGVREAVRTALAGGDPKKVFKTIADHPVLRGRNGRTTPIHTVRIAKNESTVPVGEGVSARHVLSGENHHLEMIEVDDGKRKRWDAKVVSLLQAVQRLREGRPVIEREHGEGHRFLFSLCKGDCVQLKSEGETQDLYLVSGFSSYTAGATILDLVSITDARQVSKIPRVGRTRTPDTLRKQGCRKILLSPLGEVRNASD